MKNIKIHYWVIVIFFIVFTLYVTFYNIENSDNKATAFLSGIAIIFSIIAMCLSDKKLPDFNGQIKFWTTNLNISDEGLDCPLKLSIRIENHSNTPINDLIIKFKTPKFKQRKIYNLKSTLF